VIGELAAQSQLHDIRVEPESPLAIDAGIEIKRQCDPVTQGVPDAGVYRILHARVQEEYAAVDVHIRVANLEHPIERVCIGQSPPSHDKYCASQ